ncbi:MAG: SMI1/KNR4 family protein [Lachnospiraceae bacterium]|nr:SMI1/KNR4 family protein [Lachnospiraceae bacterium]
MKKIDRSVKMKSLSELKMKYLEMFSEDALNQEELNTIEKRLGVTLPDDFKEISKYFSGGSVGIIEFYDFKDNNEINIIDETLRLRESIQLSEQYIVLAEPPESIVVMDIKNVPAIIWCDSIDIENIESNNYSSQPDTWESFCDFFYNMLLEEVE